MERMMIDMMTDQAKISDEIYEKYQVDEDEFNAAMLHYNLINDPEIRAIMFKNMQKMGMDGGMPGMGSIGGMM